MGDSTTQLSIVPRIVCEYAKTTSSANDCGTGAEFGLSSLSKNGLSNADIRLAMDRLNGGTQSSVRFDIVHRF